MNTEAAKENRRTLEQLLGLNEEVAEKILGSFVLLSDEENHNTLSKSIQIILQKTFERIDLSPNSGQKYSCEIVISNSRPRTTGPYVYVGTSPDGKLMVSRIKQTAPFPNGLHDFFYFLISCYTGGAVLKSIVGNGVQVTADDEIFIDISKLISDPSIFDKEIDLGEGYLAGAGAIGNSFLYALSNFTVRGILNIADPDFISGGNLNRCLFFQDSDIGKNKVDVLVERAQPLFQHLKLIPLSTELAKVPAAIAGGHWLQKLIVGVDSRRARRNLQSAIPREVFDASTTGIAEVVIHYNKQPLNGKACLGCIYYKEEEEQVHEKHVAETLGVSISQVCQLFIDEVASSAIKIKYPSLTTMLVGQSYDTLFKQLCAEGKLITEVDKQVLAPLAFVSSLAGALLALSVAQNISGQGVYNYWKASPWCCPNFRLQQTIPTSAHCEFCNRPQFAKGAADLWS